MGNKISCQQLKDRLPTRSDPDKIAAAWREGVRAFKGKIIVLDDDPTGTQTVSGVPVYTSWGWETLKAVREDRSRLVYILTNSRALTSAETAALHHQLGRDLARVLGKDEFLLISRSDSTLRGHYPLETEILISEVYQGKVAGEIIIPFFSEGGRITCNDIHYVREGDYFIPAGETEFARDTTFGYRASNLKKWIEEKSGGSIKAADVVSFSLAELRDDAPARLLEKLQGLKDNSRVVVNAVDYLDLQAFTTALLKALESKKYIFRTAASFVRVLGGLDAEPLLKARDLYSDSYSGSRCFKAGGKHRGLIIIGSYVEKTTRQLERLKENAGSSISFSEWQVKEAATEERTAAENKRVAAEAGLALERGKSVCIYTSRGFYSAGSRRAVPPGGTGHDLLYSARISQALVDVIKNLPIKPDFMIAKGGITSSDVAVKALGVKRAEVMGQILPGVPVWRLGEESSCPGLPYVIFPGNVGDDFALVEVVETLSASEGI